MSKILLLVALLVSTSINAHSPFQSGFFNQGFNDGFWRNFDQQFQQLDRQINQINRSNSAFSTQSRQYFDQDNNRYVIEIKISGLNKNDLDITSNKNMLVIKGSQSQQKTSNNQRSRSSSSFSHAVSIPADGDKDNISADFKNGVLKVSIPKFRLFCICWTDPDFAFQLICGYKKYLSIPNSFSFPMASSWLFLLAIECRIPLESNSSNTSLI